MILPPKRLGRYEVGAKVGGGGMATVYLGRVDKDDASSESVRYRDRIVALKVIRQELASDAGFVEMFLDEAKIIAQLTHPNISETLEVGVDDGHRFIAMELLLGRTLADIWEALVETGAKMPVDLAAWSAARVAEGLHYAHEFKTLQGEPLHIIHRDVNPTNIIVTYDGKVKLIDFGLAKSMGRLTRSAEGIVKGKVPYLSPEQATGNAIDRRTDVYTLGITLWEATTGKRLFKREDDVATIRAIQKAEVPDPRKDDPTYPEALWKIVDKALAVKPDDRYPTAQAFADDLNTFLAAREATDLEPDMTKFMSSLFPGEETKQNAWLTEATTHERPQPNVTMPPPVAVGDIEAAVLKESLAKAKAANEAAVRGANETRSEPPAAVAKSKEIEATSERATTEGARPALTVEAKATPPVEAKASESALAIPMRLWVAAAALAVLLTVVALLSRG